MNTHMINYKEPLVYNGITITSKTDMLSLTDMWKAAGEENSKRPSDWARKEGDAFIEAVSISLNMPVEHIMKTQRGKGGSTFAHWQIGLAYAKYLDHNFHMWCNQVVRDRMEGRATAMARNLSVDDKNAIGGIIKGIVHKQLAEIIPQLIEARLAEQTILVRHGKTAKQIWDAHRLPPKLRGSTIWLGNRLKEMGAAIQNNGRFDRGNVAVRLFDPDKAEVFLKNGLLHSAKVYASERMGQGKLRLVEGGAQ